MCAEAFNRSLKKVTDFVLEQAQQNQTLPIYLKVNDIIYQQCYNRMVVQSLTVIKDHAQSAGIEDYPNTVINTQDNILEIMSFAN
ncbi:12921_t:CDS:1, partial [Cetraspora pellucida]